MSRLHGDAANGLVTARQPAMLRPAAYTPVVTWAGNTITTQSGFYLKLPGLLLVWVSFVETAGTASAAITITIPTGYTAVSMAGALSEMVGYVNPSTVVAATTAQAVFAAAGATTSIATIGAVTGIVTTWSGFFAIPTLT